MSGIDLKLVRRQANPFRSPWSHDAVARINVRSLDRLYRSLTCRFVDRVDENVETRWERYETHRHSHHSQDNDFDARWGAQRRRGFDETRLSEVSAGC